MNEIEAVLRLQRGDRSAFDDLYTTYIQPAIRTAYLITRSEAIAEDAVQEAFVKVIRNVSSLRNPQSFRPWFYRIVVNAAKTLSRNIYRSIPLDLEEHDKIDPFAVTPDEATLDREEIQLLRRAVGQLDETHRVPVVLRYFTGLSEQEVADALGIPPGTVKSRLHTAREVLYERIEGHKKGQSNSLPPRPADASSGQKGGVRDD